MKKLPILTKPTSMKDFKNIDLDDFASDLRLKAEKMQIKQLRQFKQQWV
jgi:hypothetical protein